MGILKNAVSKKFVFGMCKAKKMNTKLKRGAYKSQEVA